MLFFLPQLHHLSMKSISFFCETFGLFEKIPTANLDMDMDLVNGDVMFDCL